MATIALLNLAYFGVEFVVALFIGSVSLFADSVDFIEDASVNLLIVGTLGWSSRNRARVGMALAGILLIAAMNAGAAREVWTTAPRRTPVGGLIGGRASRSPV